MRRRSFVAAAMGAVLLLAMALMPGTPVHANDPGPPQPVLGCADVNGDGAVTAGDISLVVQRFGTYYPNANYFPLYDVHTGDGSVSGADISLTVVDFGLTCPEIDTVIAQATLAITDPAFDTMAACGIESFADAGLLVENVSLLASKGYLRASSDVPGQGAHYVNFDFFTSGRFNHCTPPGLVYDNGRLYANLYFVDGNSVGWGPYEPHTEGVDIDEFCEPLSPDPSCSWPGDEDGWHDHLDLCTVGIGTPESFAIPGEFVGGFGSAQACQDSGFNDPAHPQCTVPLSVIPCWTWAERVGWMGHLWNHTQANANGRLADCYPDDDGWKGYNCPGAGVPFE